MSYLAVVALAALVAVVAVAIHLIHVDQIASGSDLPQLKCSAEECVQNFVVTISS